MKKVETVFILTEVGFLGKGIYISKVSKSRGSILEYIMIIHNNKEFTIIPRSDYSFEIQVGDKTYTVYCQQLDK